jgi:hypothetical protein
MARGASPCTPSPDGERPVSAAPPRGPEGARRVRAAGERVFNLSWAAARSDGKPVRMALVENRFASGSIGTSEAERLARSSRSPAKSAPHSSSTSIPREPRSRRA